MKFPNSERAVSGPEPRALARTPFVSTSHRRRGERRFVSGSVIVRAQGSASTQRTSHAKNL